MGFNSAFKGFMFIIIPTSDENLLRIFEWKIPWKIYGLTQEGDIWRIRNEEELNRFIKGGIL